MSISNRLCAGDLSLDEGTREALLRGVPLKLTRLEFDVLAYLLKYQNRAVNRQELLDAIWGEGYSPESNVVDVVVGSLRRKLGDDRRKPQYIVTIPAVGYRMRTPSSEAKGRRWLIFAGAVIVGVIVVFVLSIVGALVVFEPSGSGIVVSQDEGAEIVVVIETRSSAPAPVAGDCRGEDVTISGWKSAGQVSGDLTGSAQVDVDATMFFTAGCLAGALKGEMVLVDENGDRLETVLDGTFAVVQLRSLPAPAAMESADVLTVSGGTGRFANAEGYGTCQTTTLLEYDGAGSATAASRSRCRLTLSDADGTPSQAAVSVRVVANPSKVSLVGSANAANPSATNVLVLYTNEGQNDLTDLTLTLLPVDGVTMKVTSRAVEGDDEPPLRTWRLPDMRAGERHTFDFSVQFEATDRPQAPLIVRLSSPDMASPIDSEPFLVEIE